MSFSQFNNVKISGIATAVPTQKHSVDLQTASDLGFAAADKLLNEKNIDRTELGFIVFLTKTPDYRSPASAIVLQHRLRLQTNCLAYDVNLGSVGFVAGLQLGCSLLNGLNTTKGLVIIGDTNSKQLDKNDPLFEYFGDASTAILLEKQEGVSTISTQLFSQGNGYDSYIIPGGAFRTKIDRPNYELSSLPSASDFNNLKFDRDRIHAFYSETIPVSITSFMKAVGSQISDFEILAFQQSNSNTINEIVKALELENKTLLSNLNSVGDVSGSSIPLLLSQVKIETSKKRVLSCAFGEGFSWGFSDFYLDKNTILPIIETDDYFTEGFITHEI
jgi:3-oxoacyl-[acyl-carrier-protein] synthase III